MNKAFLQTKCVLGLIHTQHVNTQVPMYPINKEAAPFRSKQLLPYLVSPYVMAKDDPYKHYMAGACSKLSKTPKIFWNTECVHVHVHTEGITLKIEQTDCTHVHTEGITLEIEKICKNICHSVCIIVVNSNANTIVPPKDFFI